jgi:DNA-binding CsgD family transcriptional regulator
VAEQRLLERIQELCRVELSSKALREQILGLLRERMAFDAHVFMLTDPRTKVATSPLADVPMLPWPRLPELVRWRYLTPINRWDRLLGSPASSLRTATRSPSESLLWQHVHRELGIHDSAYVSFGDRYGAWGSLELLRTGEAFTADELDFLTALASPVATGLRAAVSRTFVDPADQLLPVGAAVVVLGPDLVVRDQTRGAAEALLRLNPPDEPMAPIPAAAYNIGAALLAMEQAVPVGEPWARVHLGGSRWVTVKASRLGADIAVSIEPSTPPERMDLFARSFGLSARETEVFSLLGTGLDSREMAAVLVLSEHTVNDHVKAILAKTGCRTRQVLLSRALGSG